MAYKHGTRPRNNRIEVWATDEELAEINKNAKESGMSRSKYLRDLGRHYQPKSYYDREAVRDMLKIHADLGRLGGLLKLWLSERQGEGARPINVRQVLRQIESSHQLMAQTFMERVRVR